MKTAAFIAAGLLVAGVATPASATEIYGGIYAHDVKTPLDASGIEKGADFQVGIRGSGIGLTPIQPYAFVAVNSAGQTSYGAIGVSARFGKGIYIRPGIGLAVHNGSTENFQDPTNDKIDFGSRILFEPEVAVGLDVAPRTSIEASWVHMSHATLFSRQNPGIDNFGVRVNFKL